MIDYFDDWYYPESQNKMSANESLTPKVSSDRRSDLAVSSDRRSALAVSSKLFEPSNLLYEKINLIVRDNICDEKNIDKILESDLTALGTIIGIKIIPSSQLRRIKIKYGNEGMVNRFNECVSFRFKTIAIGNNVLIKYVRIKK